MNETKLAVILHADVVGSTELVHRDERLAHVRIQGAFRRFSAVISKHHGIVHEIRGDAMVVEFTLASDAANAALEFQTENQDDNRALSGTVKPELRVGIALGEVVIADNTVTGAGVVLAQRIEQLAEPGGVCVSAAIREAIPARIEVAYQDLGENELKGFASPQRVYSLRATRTVVEQEAPSQDHPVVLDISPQDLRRASVAVLPFRNLSSDPEREFFAEGMTEDLVSALSKFRDIRVLPRSATRHLKDERVGAERIGKELNVRYLVEGSVRTAGSRIRVSAELIDLDSDGHLWSERFDRTLEDVFEIQDELTLRIVREIAPHVSRAEWKRLRAHPPESLDAWSSVQAAAHASTRGTPGALESALAVSKRAIALDPSYAGAYVAAAWYGTLLFRDRPGTADPVDILSWVEHALALDPANSRAHAILSRVRILCFGDIEGAIEAAESAIRLNPFDSDAHGMLAHVLYRSGSFDRALKHLNEARLLNPQHLMDSMTRMLRGAILRGTGQFDEAIADVQASVRLAPDRWLAQLMLAATLELAGRDAEAHEALTKATELEPNLSVSFYVRSRGHVSPQIGDTVLDSLRRLGLPE